MTTPWQPYREPLRTTLIRTIAIAVVVGAPIARFWAGSLSRWPMVSLLMLWPSFGGHWVELWYLNWLRPRLSPDRATQIAARIVVWFGGGCVLAIGMWLTAVALGRLSPSRWPSWWVGGLGFIAIELVAQAALQLRGRPSFYNGRG
jgi:hypothetical protein